ncbi:MAG: hypothetical protein QM656_12960 [Paracoccaceae bacterium]
MIILAFAVFGALLGVLQARRHGGRRLDLWQYAAGYAIAFGLLGLIITVFLARRMMG